MSPWYDSRFTGLFTHFGAIPRLAHDPEVFVASGMLPPWGARQQELAVGGAGWTAEEAEMACVGEAIERLQPYPLPGDRSLRASFAHWPLDEPAIVPEEWVLFHPEQYAQPGFPFEPFTRATECRWVCFRHATDGSPCWVPEEFAFLFTRPGEPHQLAPAVSTGMSCGRRGDPVLLRGVQEVIERDAVMGAWWDRYPIEEWPLREVLAGFPPDVPRRVLRPNLIYRFYRVDSPYSSHVTLTTVAGEDRAGFLFSIGSACRETRQASWNKSLLEAIHGRHYVRHLLREHPEAAGHAPVDFTEHAVYYSRHRERLRATVLHLPGRVVQPEMLTGEESLSLLCARLGP